MCAELGRYIPGEGVEDTGHGSREPEAVNSALPVPPAGEPYEFNDNDERAGL
jgi:hypothetical protein